MITASLSEASAFSQIREALKMLLLPLLNFTCLKLKIIFASTLGAKGSSQINGWNDSLGQVTESYLCPVPLHSIVKGTKFQVWALFVFR